MGHMIGYARVSTTDQDPQLQLDALAAEDCLKIYTDTATGTRASRPGWSKCLAELPKPQGDAMSTTSTSPALATALSYHNAWTSQNLDQAMTYIADGITCEAPGARITGIQQYREFLGGFMTQLTGVETVASFGDDTTAVLFYYPHTANVSDAPTAECFTVTGGKITRSVLVFDRPSFAPPQH